MVDRVHFAAIDCNDTAMQLLKTFCSLRMSRSTPVLSTESRYLIFDIAPTPPPKLVPTAPSPVSVLHDDDVDVLEEMPSRATLAATAVSAFLVKAFDKLCKQGVLQTTTPWDETNTVEVALMLALRIVEVPEAGLGSDMPQRLLLCACLTLACKAPLDSPAFGRLAVTQYRHAPLALVYHHMFNAVVTWSDRERRLEWLQRQLEIVEGWILTTASVNLFATLNNSPTEVFTVVAMDALNPTERHDSENLRGVHAMRNVVAFYVFSALSGHDDDMRRRIGEQPFEHDLQLALRCLAVLSVIICNENRLAPHFKIARSLASWASDSNLSAIAHAIQLIRIAKDVRDRSFERRCRFATEPIFGILVTYKIMKLVEADLLEIKKRDTFV